MRRQIENHFSQHPHWKSVTEVCETLARAGHQALLAGGCVRDALLGLQPQDFDVATSATPEEVEKLFARSVAVGKAFGVMVIPFEDFNVEVATFRTDGLYVDGRRPESVRFSSPKEDAERRDFTVNALFYDLISGQVVDFVNGQRDLSARVIRTVGEARRRFSEDALRLLRAVRFAAQLGFEIDPSTLEALRVLAPTVAQVSHERIRDEWLKLLKGEFVVKGLYWSEVSGLLEATLPELFQLSLESSETWIDTKAQLALSPRSLPARLVILLAGVPLHAETILLRLKFSRQETRAVLETIRNLRLLPKAGLAEKRRMLAELTAVHLLTVLQTRARWSGESALYDEMKSLKPAEAPWVTGQDALKMGAHAGPKLGVVLSQVYDLQLESRLADRDHALAWLKKNLP